VTEILVNARQIAGKAESYDDLLVDRLHHRYTVAGLVCFSIALSTYQYIGEIEIFVRIGLYPN
jgi:hypothetical protein